MTHFTIQWTLPGADADSPFEHTAHGDDLSVDESSFGGASSIQVRQDGELQFGLKLPEDGAYWIIPES